MLGQDPPHFERAVYYVGLSKEDIAELKARYDAAQMALFKQLSAEAAKMKKRTPKETATLRFRAGGYFYQEEDDAK